MQVGSAQQQAAGSRTHGPQARSSEARSAALMTGLKLLGKSLGIVKTLVIAAWFGATGALDAFWVSYTIPQMMPGLILGVVTLSFIPSFMRTARHGQENVDWRGLNTLFTMVAIVLIGITVAVVIFRDALVTAMAPGLPDDVHALAAELMAWMSIAVLFFGVNSMLSAIMQATHRFALMSLESVVTNVVIISGAILFADTLGVRGLVYAVIAGFGTHMVLLIAANWDLIRTRLRPAFDYAHQDFQTPAKHMLPLLVGFFGAIGVTIVDRIFVSTLESGAISVLVYASTIALLPMEVFGHAVFTAYYPTLSRDYSNRDTGAMRDSQVRGMRLLLFVLVPTTAGLVMMAEPIVEILLERGAFSATATQLTAGALAALAIGLPFRAVNYFNFRVFHARKEPWTAVSIGLFGVVINILMDMLLIEAYGVVGIAFATSIAMGACVLLSTVLLQRRQKINVMLPMIAPTARILLMTAVMLTVAYLLIRLLATVEFGLDGWAYTLLELSTFIPAGAAFLLTGYLLGLSEVSELFRFVRARAFSKEAS